MAQKKTKNNRFVDERSGGRTWNHGVNLVLNIILQPPLTPPVVLSSY